MRKIEFLHNITLTLGSMISHDSTSSNNDSSATLSHRSSLRARSDTAIANASCTSQESTADIKIHALNGYPLHFTKGSLIQLASGKIKNIEDLETSDFVESADLCPDVSLEHSRVMRLEPIQAAQAYLLSFNLGRSSTEVTLSTSPEHPFFVFGQGWASCSPSLTLARYGLSCRQLRPGDTCVSLSRTRQ